MPHAQASLRPLANRVIPIWNSVSDYVVSAETVNAFTRRLDKLWTDQDVLYNYKADLHGIGNRSISVIFLNQ